MCSDMCGARVDLCKMGCVCVLRLETMAMVGSGGAVRWHRCVSVTPTMVGVVVGTEWVE